MTTALAPLDLSQLPSTQLGDDSSYADCSANSFLGRLRLFTKGEAIDSGLIKPGHFGIEEAKDSIVDLGDSIDVLPLACKHKAVDSTDREAIIVTHDGQSAEYQRIKAAADKKEEGEYQYGVAFLVFERSSARLLELFFGNKSSRKEIDNLRAFLPVTTADAERRGIAPRNAGVVTIKSRLVKGKKFSWHVPVIFKCSTPIESLPPTTVAEIGKFLTIKDSEIESVASTGNERAR
jgi:hypothetical protein